MNPVNGSVQNDQIDYCFTDWQIRFLLEIEINQVKSKIYCLWHIKLNCDMGPPSLGSKGE